MNLNNCKLNERTRDEFNQRKAERQNKPSWSDAPKWANWLAQDADGQWVWYKTRPLIEGNAFDSGERLLGRGFGEVIGNWQDTLEQRPAATEKEQDMNGWYEKGELPPVGEICKLVSQGMTLCGFDVEITYIGDEVGCYKRLKDSKEFTFASSEVVFHPLPTETDKLVEQMERSFESTGCVFTNDHRALAEHLIEQGYRKIKPMSEQEFMKQCVDICGYGDARLYRAGCRFIEQVKV